MNVEDKMISIINDFKSDLARVSEEAISSAYGEILPHVENDTFMNVQYRSQRVIENMIAGKFKSDGDNTVIVEDDNGINVKIKITDSQWDNMRASLLSALPVCPKDLEIESLKNTIELMEKSTLF